MHVRAKAYLRPKVYATSILNFFWSRRGSFTVSSLHTFCFGLQGYMTSTLMTMAASWLVFSPSPGPRRKLLSCETSPVLTIPNRHNLTELRAPPYGTRAEVGRPTKCDSCRTYRIQWSSGASDDFLQPWGGLLPFWWTLSFPCALLPLPSSLDLRKLLMDTALRKPSFSIIPFSRTNILKSETVQIE